MPELSIFLNVSFEFGNCVSNPSIKCWKIAANQPDNSVLDEETYYTDHLLEHMTGENEN